MNILFFLTPKSEVSCAESDMTVRQTLEKLENSGFAALPIINRQGRYVGTVSEGDLLWFIKHHANLNLTEAEDIPLKEVKRRKDNKPVAVTETMDSLFEKVYNQNFVPVTDDDGIFIGIVTRKDIMHHVLTQVKNEG